MQRMLWATALPFGMVVYRRLMDSIMLTHKQTIAKYWLADENDLYFAAILTNIRESAKAPSNQSEFLQVIRKLAKSYWIRNQVAVFLANYEIIIRPRKHKDI